MITYAVVFTPEAQAQLISLYRYVGTVASPEVAARYTNAIVTYCEGLSVFPHRGVPRDDIRPGLRVTTYRKRTVIAFDVDVGQVAIIGVFYGGQDYEAALQTDADPEQ